MDFGHPALSLITMFHIITISDESPLFFLADYHYFF